MVESFLYSIYLVNLVSMNLLIESTLKTLQKSKSLLSFLSNEQLSDASVSPYYSSIGSHLRHILDFYECIFSASNSIIDLTERRRNPLVECDCYCANDYLDKIINSLKSFNDLEKEVKVIDDLGLGKLTTKYTMSAILVQANSHTIHHYAIINYILDGLNINVNDSDFGYNPTTPKKVVEEN